MRYFSSVACFALLCAAFAVFPAEARHHELPGFGEQHHVEAIHRPTGCMARLDYEGEIPVAAFIVDPICLPAGISQREIPFDPRDFHLPASHRAPFRRR